MTLKKRICIVVILCILAVSSLLFTFFLANFIADKIVDAPYRKDKINSVIYYERVGSDDPAYFDCPDLVKQIILYDKNNEIIAHLNPETDLGHPATFRQSNDGTLPLKINVEKVNQNGKTLYEKSAFCEHLDLYEDLTNTTFKRIDGEFVDLQSSKATVITNVTQYENVIVQHYENTSDMFWTTYTLLYFVEDLLYVYQVSLVTDVYDPEILEKINEICV